MADTTDDASNGAAEPKLSFQEQMAEIKRNAPAADDDGSSNDDDKGNGDDATKKGAEANDASADDLNDDDGADDKGDGSGTGDDADDDKGTGDEGQKFEPRFTQFKGDGKQDTYIKNLEEGYQNSSSEAIRIKDERDGFENQVNAIKQAAAADPKFGERLLDLLNGKGGGSGSDDDGKSDDLTNKADADSKNPFLKDAETNWNKESEAEAKAFTDANPEVLSDPKINADVKRWMRVFSNETFETEGRLMKAGEAMEKAYKYLGLEDKRNQQQDLVNGMKQNAAPTRPQAPKKKSSGGGSDSKQFSNLTLDIASKMNISKDRLAKGAKR